MFRNKCMISNLNIMIIKLYKKGWYLKLKLELNLWGHRVVKHEVQSFKPTHLLYIGDKNR